MRTPEVRLDDDGRHILWSHECNFAPGWVHGDPTTEGNWREGVMLPINDERGWRVEQKDPLTVSPSILCRSCGTHGFWRAGAWVPA